MSTTVLKNLGVSAVMRTRLLHNQHILDLLMLLTANPDFCPVIEKIDVEERLPFMDHF